jgi:hypothetical protein
MRPRLDWKTSNLLNRDLALIRYTAAKTDEKVRFHILFFALIRFEKTNIPVNKMTIDRIMSWLSMEAAFHNVRGAYR